MIRDEKSPGLPLTIFEEGEALFRPEITNMIRDPIRRKCEEGIVVMVAVEDSVGGAVEGHHCGPTSNHPSELLDDSDGTTSAMVACLSVDPSQVQHTIEVGGQPAGRGDTDGHDEFLRRRRGGEWYVLHLSNIGLSSWHGAQPSE